VSDNQFNLDRLKWGLESLKKFHEGLLKYKDDVNPYFVELCNGSKEDKTWLMKGDEKVRYEKIQKIISGDSEQRDFKKKFGGIAKTSSNKRSLQGSMNTTLSFSDRKKFGNGPND